MDYGDGTNWEQAIFKASDKDGLYRLMRTAWGDTLYNPKGVFQETFDYVDGKLSSCTGNQCSSCSICPDGSSIDIDCSALGNDLFYTTVCDDKYKGSFFNLYEMKIKANTDIKTKIQTTEEFCADLSPLEEYMKTSFETLMGSTLTMGYPCTCGQPDPDTLQIDCSMDYGDGTNWEQAIFKASDKDGLYRLMRTAWGDTLYNPKGVFQETFDYVDGKLSSCTGNQCSSCSICPDGSSIDIDCSALGNDLFYTTVCDDKYKGSFFNLYEIKLKTKENKKANMETEDKKKIDEANMESEEKKKTDETDMDVLIDLPFMSGASSIPRCFVVLAVVGALLTL